MNNPQKTNMTRLEQIRLRKTEKKVADVIALPIALVLAILFYLGEIAVKILYRFKRQLFKLSLTIGVVFFLTNALGVVANAPRADASHPYIKVLNHPVTEHDQIIAYIKEVFGQDADKAFELLNCENHALNPFALNDNEAWGGVGKDYGIFQINNKWQGVTNEAFLYDWKINILIAHNIYTRDGNTFKLWTCGRKLGI